MFHAQGPTFVELARQALSSTQKGYDLLAPKFDYTPFRTPDFVLEAVYENLKRKLKPRADSLAIDFFCGTGAGMELLQKLGFQRIVGVDFSEGMLAQAKKNLAGAKSDLTWIQADILSDDRWATKRDLACDLGVSFGAFGHILPRQESRFVNTLSQTLAPGGQFIFVTTTKLPLWSPAYWMARGFNAAMHIRNAFWRPPFIMFYLTFLWPAVAEHFRQAGMEATAEPLFPGKKKLRHVLIVTATKN